MAPPCFSDLGKQARDVFNKDYNINLVKLDCKTKTNSGVEFTVNGTNNTENGKVTSSLEAKYKFPDHGITLSEKWSSENVLNAKITAECQKEMLKGLQLSISSKFDPHSGKKSALLMTAYEANHVNMGADVDIDMKSPNVYLSSVLDFKGWLAGVQATVDAMKSKVKSSNFAFGYKTDDFVVHTNVNDGQEFGASFHQKVNSKLATGVQIAWASGSPTTNFGLGCVYTLDSDTSLRAKINNSSQIGLGITHRLRKGIQLTLSAMIDARSFDQGGHRLGLGLNLEA